MNYCWPFEAVLQHELSIAGIIIAKLQLIRLKKIRSTRKSMLQLSSAPREPVHHAFHLSINKWVDIVSCKGLWNIMTVHVLSELRPQTKLYYGSTNGRWDTPIEAFNHHCQWVIIRYGTYRKLLNPRCLNGVIRVNNIIIRHLLFADDCALCMPTRPGVHYAAWLWPVFKILGQFWNNRQLKGADLKLWLKD